MKKREIWRRLEELKRIQRRLNMKAIGIIALAIIGIIVVISLLVSKSLLKKSLDAEQINKVQIVLAMGNPKYGSESKVIEDEEEIAEIVEIFNMAKLDRKVKEEDIQVTMASRYIFYRDDKIIEEIYFNGDDTERVYIDSECYYTKYSDQSPFEFYQQSKAKTIKVDIDLNEIE